jgi:hypothetical protein
MAMYIRDRLRRRCRLTIRACNDRAEWSPFIAWQGIGGRRYPHFRSCRSISNHSQFRNDDAHQACCALLQPVQMLWADDVLPTQNYRNMIS